MLLLFVSLALSSKDLRSRSGSGRGCGARFSLVGCLRSDLISRNANLDVRQPLEDRESDAGATLEIDRLDTLPLLGNQLDHTLDHAHDVGAQMLGRKIVLSDLDRAVADDERDVDEEDGDDDSNR